MLTLVSLKPGWVFHALHIVALCNYNFGMDHLTGARFTNLEGKTSAKWLQLDGRLIQQWRTSLVGIHLAGTKGCKHCLIKDQGSTEHAGAAHCTAGNSQQWAGKSWMCLSGSFFLALIRKREEQWLNCCKKFYIQDRIAPQQPIVQTWGAEESTELWEQCGGVTAQSRPCFWCRKHSSSRSAKLFKRNLKIFEH